MIENRGRPKETESVKVTKIVRTYYEVPSKPEIGYKSVWHYDDEKSKFGPWRTEHTTPKGEKHPKVKIEKNKSYNNQPVALVFKTSKNSNAKTKMKVWNNTNIDYILTADKLPGVPENAVILEVGVGKGNIERWRSKYIS
jgi:hypothetical protein